MYNSPHIDLIAREWENCFERVSGEPFLLHLVTYPIQYKYTHCVDHSNGSKCYEAHQEPQGISVQLEVHGFRVENGPHQIPLGCVETWKDKLKSFQGENILKYPLQRMEGFKIIHNFCNLWKKAQVFHFIVCDLICRIQKRVTFVLGEGFFQCLRRKVKFFFVIICWQFL